MGGPNALIRRGWTRNSLKPDDLVTFEGSLARDGSRLVNARSLVMTESGRRMFAGSSGRRRAAGINSALKSPGHSPQRAP